MSNQYIMIELDRPRRLKYDMNALCEIEDRLGITIAELSTIKVGMKQTRTIIWAGLVHEDGELTEQQVGSFITMENMVEVQEKMANALAKNYQKANGSTGRK